MFWVSGKIDAFSNNAMKKFKAVIAYDGTDYHGWQSQKDKRTISQTIEKQYYLIFGQQIKLLGASRTDSGVHAAGQIAVFSCSTNLQPNKLVSILNNSLPPDIKIRSMKTCPDNFNPLQGVKEKVYLYHLFKRKPLPFFARFGWHFKFIDQVDFSIFNNAMCCFVGSHDFKSFCKSEPGLSTTRTIDSIKIEKLDKLEVIRIKIIGKGFLRHQIRRIIGASLDVARRKELSIQQLKKQLESPRDQQAFTKAEGCGLCLWKISY
jgi:tRNA pseudouridine38-40 synthase